MPYTNITVTVPEEHVPDLYEFLASLTRRTTAGPDFEVEPESQPGRVLDDKLPRLMRNVNPGTRDMLAALAERPEEELSYEQLESHVKGQSLGGAMKSLQVQSRRLQMEEPIQRRVVTLVSDDGDTPKKRKVYSMDAATAAEILRILGRD